MAPASDVTTPRTLRERRRHEGKTMTILRAAADAEVAYNSVVAVERGDDVNTRTLLALAAVYGVKPATMFAAWLNVRGERK